MKNENTLGIESAATLLSESEIDMVVKDPYKIIVDKLNYLKDHPNQAYTDIIHRFARELAGIDYVISEKGYKGISYYAKKRRYSAEKTIKGEYFFIKTSIHYHVVEEAYLNFCKKHGIEP